MTIIERVAQLHGVDPEEVRKEIQDAARLGTGLEVEPEGFIQFLAQAVLNERKKALQDPTEPSEA